MLIERHVLRLYHRSSDRTLIGRLSTSPASDRLNKVVDGRSSSSSPKFGMTFAVSQFAPTCLQLRAASSPLAACSPAPGPVVAQQVVCVAKLPRSNLFPCPVRLPAAVSSSQSRSPPLVPTPFSISEKYAETNSSKIQQVIKLRRYTDRVLRHWFQGQPCMRFEGSEGEN